MELPPTNDSLQRKRKPSVAEGIEKAKASSESPRNEGVLNTNTSSVTPPCVARSLAPLMMRPSDVLSTIFAEMGSSEV